MAPARILLIDSDLDSIAIYSMMLRHHGYEVLQALDGETGLRLALEQHPDVVVSELFLPGSGSTTLLARLEEDGRTADLPIIVLDSTSTFGPGLTQEFGAHRRLAKPCEPSRLLKEVESLLSGPVAAAG
jgi:CheY-like chemotaxis protein